MSLYDVITIGEPMVVFIAEEFGKLKDVKLFSKGLAGAELNTSIGLSRLGHSVSYITQLGCDPFGEYIYDCIEKRAILTKITLKKTSKYTTGFYLKSKVLNGGDPDIFYYRENSAAANINSKFVQNVKLEHFKHFHVTGITPSLSENMLNSVINLVKIAIDKGLSISFDPNLRPQLWESQEKMVEVLNYIATFSDYIMPNIEEGKILTNKDRPEEIAEFFLNKGTKNVVIKLGGEKGCFVKKSQY